MSTAGLATMLAVGLAGLAVASSLRAARTSGLRRAPQARWTTRARGPLLALVTLAALSPGPLAGDGLVLLIAALVVVGSLLLLAQLPYLPWHLARRVAIPLGMPRLAYALARATAIEWIRDPAGGPAFAAAWALLARKQHAPAIAAWIEAKLADGAMLAGAGVTATGLVAASRGDRARARELLRSSLTMRVNHSPPLARAAALDWLLADAAERGAWSEAARLARDEKNLSPGSSLIAGAAARILGQPSPHDVSLRLAWLRGGRRATARPLLARALARPRVMYAAQARAAEPPPPASDEPEIDGDPLTRALTLHLHWLSAGAERLAEHPSALARVTSAWEAALHDVALARKVDERMRLHGAQGSADDTLRAIRAEVIDDLTELAATAEVPLAALDQAPPESVGGQLRATLRRRLLEEVEAASGELGRRVELKRSLSAIEEWSEFIALRRLCARATALGGLELRRLIFPKIHRDACAHAVWLWNDRDEYAVAMPVFDWLLVEAEAVEDESAIELQRKNTRAKA